MFELQLPLFCDWSFWNFPWSLDSIFIIPYTRADGLWFKFLLSFTVQLKWEWSITSFYKFCCFSKVISQEIPSFLKSSNGFRCKKGEASNVCIIESLNNFSDFATYWMESFSRQLHVSNDFTVGNGIDFSFYLWRWIITYCFHRPLCHLNYLQLLLQSNSSLVTWN